MKKVRISLKRGKKEWSFVLYDSIESAFYMNTDPSVQNPEGIDEKELSKIVTLSPGDIAEIEWLGSEWIYNDESAKFPTLTQQDEKYDNVVIGKARPSKHQKIEVYTGWVKSGDIPWSKDDKQVGVRIIPVIREDESKVDYSTLYSAVDITTENDVEVITPKLSN